MSLTEDRPVFLQGNGAPVTEEVTLTDLQVNGAIPTELDGRYLRNGGNPFTGMIDHPFLGDGMIHGVRLREGRAEWYRNRYVKTPFLADPTLSAVDMTVMTDMTYSKANTHVIGHAGRILALEEGHFPYVLDGSLDTVGPIDFEQGLKGSFTAHPKICATTGELLGFGYSFMEPHLRYVRISADGVLLQDEPITVTGPTMMHDFNVTEHFVIFMDLPAIFDMELAMRGEMPIHWSDDYPARLGVMPRTGSDADVVWYDLDPCYVFHPMNAYEDGDRIVIDVARLDHIWRDGPIDFPTPSLYRWIIDQTTGKVVQSQLDDRSAEFPRVPDAKVGQPYRYGYMAANAGEEMITDPLSVSGAIFKYDLHTGAQSTLQLGAGRLPGEAVFVPAATGRAEDDGYLMTYVYDASTNSSEFVVLDAATMDPTPIASVPLPRIPFGFHGSWVPSTTAN